MSLIATSTKAEAWLQSVGWQQRDWLSVVSDWSTEHRIRDKFIAKFGFAILTGKVVEFLRPFGPFVEVGAGSGYWSYELNQAGVESIATDPKTGRYSFFGDNKTLANWRVTEYLPVEPITGIEAVRKYPKHALLTVWPDMDSWPAETLAEYQGQTIVYVGEGQGGCTADAQFHALLDKLFEETVSCGIPNFYGVHDHVAVWRRL